MDNQNILQQIIEKYFTKPKSPIAGYTPQNISNPIPKDQLNSMQANNYDMEKNRVIDEYFKSINPTATPTPPPSYISVAQKMVNAPQATATPTASPTPTPEAIMQAIQAQVTPTQAQPSPAPQGDYVDTEVLPRTRKYGIPDAVAGGQWAAEGRFKNPENNNWFNLMYDGKVHPYQSLDTQVADYALTIENLLKNQGKNLKDIKDPMEVLKLMQSGKTRFEGHNKDPMAYVNLVASTPEFKARYSPTPTPQDKQVKKILGIK